jgi:hypothetical protein
MKNLSVPLPLAAAAVLITGLIVSMASKPANVLAQARSSYAEDRAAIEDLQARYLFALDFHDPDLYVSTFTEDGVLDYGSGEVKGRQAIKTVIAGMPNPKQVAGKRAGAARHSISNIVIRVDGNKASGRSYGSTTPTTIPNAAASSMVSDTTKDELVKVNGTWLFTKRKIYNEGRDEWAYKGGKNPAW